MDKNTIIGFLLLGILFFTYVYINAPTQEELKEQERVRDSIEMAQKVQDNLEIKPTNTIPTDTPPTNDSLLNIQVQGKFGDFANAGRGTEITQVLENDFIKITFTNKGGHIKEVELKRYKKAYVDEDKQELYTTLKLLEDDKNKFSYSLPLASGQAINTSDLYFTPSYVSNNSITFSVSAGNGKVFQQIYTLNGDYTLDYTIKTEGLESVLSSGTNAIKLNWENYLDKLEINDYYERSFSTVYFKEADDDPSYCSCRGDDEQELEDPIHWISHSNQFFNSTLIAKDKSFASAIAETKALGDDNEDLKKVSSELVLPLSGSGEFAMQMYIGPNEFDRLRSFGIGFEDIIPYGWSFFGTINRWVIRPIFNFFSSFIGTKGLVILLITFLVKLVLYPLSYKMYYSQAKMAALKPQIEKLKEKTKGDSQQQQMETMKLYRETGVSPLGGCMPMFIQMPIWIALYRYFPASIEFRQESFLWATDLSNYDAFFNLPFELPFFGSHLSLFTILWAISLLVYTYYNSKHMDYSAQPAMKYVQYFMPLMFLFIFNSMASGLTCYMFFSNLLNIFQTVGTKKFMFDDEKIKAELEANKKKPKKKGGFQERLQKALEEQQKIAQQQKDSASKNKKKKR